MRSPPRGDLGCDLTGCVCSEIATSHPLHCTQDWWAPPLVLWEPRHVVALSVKDSRINSSHSPNALLSWPPYKHPPAAALHAHAIPSHPCISAPTPPVACTTPPTDPKAPSFLLSSLQRGCFGVDDLLRFGVLRGGYLLFHPPCIWWLVCTGRGRCTWDVHVNVGGSVDVERLRTLTVQGVSVDVVQVFWALARGDSSTRCAQLRANPLWKAYLMPALKVYSASLTFFSLLPSLIVAVPFLGRHVNHRLSPLQSLILSVQESFMSSWPIF